MTEREIGPYAEVDWRATAYGKRICTEGLARSLEHLAAQLKRRPPEHVYPPLGFKLK